MSIAHEERAGQRDLLSLVLDSLDVRCVTVGETTIGRSQTAGPDDVGPVFYAVLDATCWFRRPGETPVELTPGDLLVLPFGGAHRLSDAPFAPGSPSDQQASEGEAGSGIAKRSKDGRLLRGCIEYSTPRRHPLCLDLPGEIHLKDTSRSESQPILAPAIQAVRCALSEPAAGTASLINLLGQLVFVEAIRKAALSRVPIQPGLLRALRDPELAPTLAMVYQAPAREWTLESLAHEAGMSRSSFARRFKELMGIPAMTWITDLRMRLASNLLRDRTVSLKRVAANVGYASVTSFSTAFKRWAGRAPSGYRASLVGRALLDKPTVAPVGSEATDRSACSSKPNIGPRIR